MRSALLVRGAGSALRASLTSAEWASRAMLGRSALAALAVSVELGERAALASNRQLSRESRLRLVPVGPPIKERPSDARPRDARRLCG